MISPDDFYSSDDTPKFSAKRKMWRAIQQSLPERKRSSFFMIPDMRSFAYGMAASLILYLAGVGAFNLIKQNLELSQPAEARLDNAYQSAIREFEAVVPSIVSGAKEQQVGKLESRTQQLKLVNEAIMGLRTEISRTGPSPITSSRLRELYGLKLQILQTMIENGEVEL